MRPRSTILKGWGDYSLCKLWLWYMHRSWNQRVLVCGPFSPPFLIFLSFIWSPVTIEPFEIPVNFFVRSCGLVGSCCCFYDFLLVPLPIVGMRCDLYWKTPFLFICDYNRKCSFHGDIVKHLVSITPVCLVSVPRASPFSCPDLNTSPSLFWFLVGAEKKANTQVSGIPKFKRRSYDWSDNFGDTSSKDAGGRLSVITHASLVGVL